ncbi:hypothetical protein [Pedobacter duraquae]|uniref:Uncharacterized protein n=1 Tax=Pedobacter duraquae TaxID=425511 RepID=A0A4R6ILI6_9SPHI|nr:hypothetical protein [Pedobacter duraquae]TDO22921.1 hypothetical protein CLV32_1906 [Pedobacter duraquae]
MVELNYFLEDNQSVYQIIQFRTGEPWRIVDAGELLGSIEKLEGMWYLRGKNALEEKLITGIGELIDAQNFNRLPAELKTHWSPYVHEALAQGDNEYLIVCKPDIDFDRFEKIFRSYIGTIVKDQWEIRFRIYDSMMSRDFEVVINKMHD